MTIKEAKKRLKATDDHIAQWFGYKNVNSYRHSSGKANIENGIIEVIKAIEEQPINQQP